MEVQPANSETAYRISFFGDDVESITHFDPLTGEVLTPLENLVIWPATEYVTSTPSIERAVDDIRAELEEQVAKFDAEGKMLEAHRLRQRTEYDLEMLKELGFCSGIENYSRHLEGRPEGSHPFTLIDYFPDDFVVFVDESHQTIPQIGGMSEGDRSRKQTLVDYGFRLPSAIDNRPLRFDEFLAKVPQLVFVSATPGAYELRNSAVVAEQLIRPTFVVDPEVEVRPTKNQIDDLLNEIRRREEAGERVLVTTLTKKMAEDLTDYLLEAGVRARYLHSEIDTLERISIIRELRLGEYDVLVGVNLLREGLDLPEVSFIAILDADKEGFLRGKTALVQTIGRAARNVNGRVVLYADKITEAIAGARRGDGPQAREAGRVQRGARHHAGDDRQGRVRHRRVPLARVADGAGTPAARRPQGRRAGPRRAREARHRAGGGDVPRRGGAPLRVRGEAPRRDQGPAARAADTCQGHALGGIHMCRNIHTLHNYEPPATEEGDAALQYVRKISGSTKPSKANEARSTRRRRGAAATSRLLDARLGPAETRGRAAKKRASGEALRRGRRLAAAASRPSRPHPPRGREVEAASEAMRGVTHSPRRTRVSIAPVSAPDARGMWRSATGVEALHRRGRASRS